VHMTQPSAIITHGHHELPLDVLPSTRTVADAEVATRNEPKMSSQDLSGEKSLTSMVTAAPLKTTGL
jgi:hypothetical protein